MNGWRPDPDLMTLWAVIGGLFGFGVIVGFLIGWVVFT